MSVHAKRITDFAPAVSGKRIQRNGAKEPGRDEICFAWFKSIFTTYVLEASPPLRLRVFAPLR
jgi:hypothetical protein